MLNYHDNCHKKVWVRIGTPAWGKNTNVATNVYGTTKMKFKDMSHMCQNDNWLYM